MLCFRSWWRTCDMRILWMIAGGVCVALGLIGAVLPLLPTVPFLLLAAFCFARSSERLHTWLVTHPKLGQPIQDWNEHGAIRPRAKIAASVAIAASFGVSLWLGVGGWVLVIQALTLAAVATFIWTRPDG